MNYHKLRRNFSIPHSFEILPCSSEGKVYKFSCATDTERLEWMRAIYISMLAVHKEALPDHEHIKLKKPEEYNLLESTVGASASAAKLYEIEDEDESSDDNYDKPDESIVKHNKYEPDPTTKYVSTTGTIPEETNSKRIQKSFSEQRETYEDAASPNETVKQRSFSEGTVNVNAGNTSVDTVNSTSVQTKTKPKPQVAPKPAKPAKQKMYINSLNAPESSNSRTKSPASRLRMTAPDSHSRTNSPASNLRTSLPSRSRTESPPTELQLPVSSDSSSRPSSRESDKQSRSPEPTISTPRKTPPCFTKRGNLGDTNYLNMTEEAGYVQPDPGLDPASEYMFSGNRDDSARELQLLADRTFLVRDSSEPGKKVLVVKTKAGLKSYKIEIEKHSEKFMIEANLTFDTLHEVLEHYKRHNLPNIGIPLRLGYNAKQSSVPDDDDYEPVGQPLL
ncbi:uncharacterized protein LOC127736124 isoform X2 [Mytilus californianus]|nr:uncharacterized protein LOC127736124 isoform X2 [Mytilus californianus]XP_052102632.1 uncharacterized protein LOC127736124 isoform X2 [Mytilus californianus]XP_052102633.1 uncharacterized protein LOC127736124 isoform X2 [Mytilus californianus]